MPIDPQQDRAADDQHEADDPDVEQHILDEAVADRADDRRRQERDQHADDEAACRLIAEHGGRDAPKPPEIDGQDRQNGAELDQHHEGLAESVVVEAEETLDQQQMPGRGHRQELGQTLDDAEDEGLEKVESHSSSEEAGKAVAKGRALVPHHSPGATGSTRAHSSALRASGAPLTGSVASSESGTIVATIVTRQSRPGTRLPRTTSTRTVGRGLPSPRVRSSPSAIAASPRRMLTLFHHPFCPHSRFVRLALGEYGTDRAAGRGAGVGAPRRNSSCSTRPAPRRCWSRKAAPRFPTPASSPSISTKPGGGRARRPRLLPRESGARVEVRRLMSWFNDKFFAEVSGPLMTERVYKRHMPASAGGGSPDTEVIRAARHNIRYHLAYIGWLVRTRDWLGGDRMSYADLAAAAHLSVVDYLGDVPWNEDEAAKIWYARVKSRPSFRPMLAETLAGIPPSKTYADLDF